ncbi:MAG: heterodisulfide reductase-related iron-sulfur binding cluster [Candidatus Binatia bacterium]|nr:heterodisulfide reductase-related iron-sulfur binding cluster [Candidatus Binatia bacterium]
MEEVTREIFWNISLTGKIVMYVVLLTTFLGAPLYLAYHWWRRIRVGTWEHRFDNLPERFRRLLFDAFGQGNVLKEKPAGLYHLALFVAFVGLFIGTGLITLEHDTPLHFYFGPFYKVYKFVMDTCGLILIVAAGLFLYRRFVQTPAVLEGPPPEQLQDNFENRVGYGLPLVLLLAIGVTGFMLEGVRIATNPESHPGWGYMGIAFAALFAAAEAGPGTHLAIWWIHVLIIAAFFASVALTKMRHMFIAPLNIFFSNLQPRGRLSPITDFENAETFGVSQIEEYTWKQLLDMAACLECGRCTINCPTVNTNKPLNPKKLVIVQREHLVQKTPFLYQLAAAKAHQAAGDRSVALPVWNGPDMITEVATEEVIWGCTTCGWCEEGCPVNIEHIQRIVDMRRYDVMMESRFPQEVTSVFKNLEVNSNPWGIGYDKRANWAADLGVKTLAEDPHADVLYWVGCAGSFDERNQKVSRAMVSILQTAGVRFAILGIEEGCTGDPARRLGNEYLYYTLARQNIETLNRYNVKEVVTHCPHCFHTLKNEYPDLGGRYTVYHSSEYIEQLLKRDLITPQHAFSKRVTFHDPCYLSRHNRRYDAPRTALEAIPQLQLREIPQSKTRTFCCGAGGGAVWKEEREGSRINQKRLEQLLAATPDTIAVGCPFCMIMMDDAVKGKNVDEQVEVKDLVELVAESLRTRETTTKEQDA